MIARQPVSTLSALFCVDCIFVIFVFEKEEDQAYKVFRLEDMNCI